MKQLHITGAALFSMIMLIGCNGGGNGGPINTDPTPTPVITPSPAPSPTPTQTPLAVSNTIVLSSAGRIATIQPNGSQLKVLTSGGQDYSPTFSPDKSRIAFVRNRANGGIITGDLIMMNANGSQARRVVDSGVRASGLSFSPDGQRIAFVAAADSFDVLTLINVDGTGSRAITIPTPRIGAPTFTPTGNQLIFRQIGGASAGSGIYRINSDGTGRALLIKISGEGGLDLSPDGRKIVFNLFDQPGTTNSRLYTINSDGSNMRLLPIVEASRFSTAPVFSPDGSQIVFTGEMSAGFRLFTVLSRGGTPRRLTTDSYDFAGDW